ncbi:N-6 DNA methylase [Microtetraspora sp. NBRC 16547]|uniref:N-6 DNA methylase n=1 Tax=Microtetraspora sp. NBRC 16547 TaxID=3030993 RepID=UPI002555093E|nr:N-6 DNA methylase [Microtetraspora sp. NBRC 16547]
MAGVGRAAVSNWRRRHDDFPQPVGGTSTSPAFSLVEIQGWLRGHSDGRRLPADEWLWQELRAAVNDDDLADLIADMGAFLVYIHREADDWGKLSSSDDDASVVAALPGRIRTACAGIIGGDAFPERLPRNRMSLIRSIARLAEERGTRDTFEFLRERYFEVHTRRVYFTPPEIVSLALDLAGQDVGSVFDPACGAGGFLFGALEHRPGTRLMGQDADRVTAHLTAVRLALCSDNVEIRAGDSLRADAFPGELVDAVVCNPPFNDRNWGHEELTADPRWEYGLPPRVESELAWAQHALAHLQVGGVAVLLMPPAVANRRSGRRIRAQLLRRGALRAVIALPMGSMPNMAVALTLWVLQRPSEGRSPSHVLMVDTSARPEDYAQSAVQAWRAFVEGHELDEPGLSRSVPLIDVLDDDVDLIPARYLSPAVEGATSPERVTGAGNRMVDLLHALAKLVPVAETVTKPRDLPLIPLSELVRRGMLTVHYQHPLRPGEESEVPDGSAVLTAGDVAAGQPASGTTPERAVRKTILTHPGDVVVPQVTQQLVARVIHEGGAVLGSHLHLLRPDPELLDPDFLAGFICSSINLRHCSSMSSRYRVDVRRAEVPLLPIEEQRRYGEAFRRLAVFESSLHQAAALGEDLVQLMADGLTHGTVQPSTTENLKGTR